KDALESDRPVREVLDQIDPDDLKILRGFGFLTSKPLLILLNVGESQLGEKTDAMVAEARERFGRPGV
ncbi:MAG: redox-regulated ATPase YchF, partial [Chloroflexota bacterium]